MPIVLPRPPLAVPALYTQLTLGALAVGIDKLPGVFAAMRFKQRPHPEA